MLLGFVVGVVAENALEWAVHKHVLHGLGRKKESFWAFHWHDHHKNVRKSGGYDTLYEGPLLSSSAKMKEAIGVMAGALAATPLIRRSPGFVAGAWAASAAYYFVHRKAHLDPDWARRWVPWHVDHHLGPDQDANWCVTFPLFDVLLSTRKPFVGTDAERAPKASSTVVAAAGSRSASV